MQEVTRLEAHCGFVPGKSTLVPSTPCGFRPQRRFGFQKDTCSQWVLFVSTAAPDARRLPTDSDRCIKLKSVGISIYVRCLMNQDQRRELRCHSHLDLRVALSPIGLRDAPSI